MCYIHMKYLAIKRSEVLIHAITRMNLENIMLSQRNQSQKTHVARFHLYEMSRIGKSFFLTSLLEYNCFTMVCYFLLYNKVNQLYIYTCSHISSLLCLPPSHPPYLPPLGGHKAPADLPVLCGCFPLAIYFTFGSVYMMMAILSGVR